ncbi:P-loop containing nucleoside triphosphate hydrolase protein [Phlyctochytrium arcticum]|nr:P-loop containing nucleoside triphosphate hydrolase protein [Phlyctochytrium arcticum]
MEDLDRDAGMAKLMVSVRIRPLTVKELAKENLQITARALDDQEVLMTEPNPEQFDDVLRQNRPKERIYTFDRVFGQDASQSVVFDQTVKYLIDWVVNGYNATVFAYGATGAGKTYTMLGTESDPGIMALTLEELFRHVEKRTFGGRTKGRAKARRPRTASSYDSGDDEDLDEDEDEEGEEDGGVVEDPNATYTVSLSYLEIYNENIRDLLSGKADYLDLREDTTRGVVVAGITTVAARSPDEVLGFLRKGNRHRTQESTGANEVSSRSHAVLQVWVGCRTRNAKGAVVERMGKLSLIDLAGSERAAETKNRGMRMIEGANINRSLLALGNCITALSDTSPKRKQKYVNYRDSKLTRLLKDSLGGNCRTVMIANISPGSWNFDETVNTLKYATRAGAIKTKVVQQQIQHKADPYSATISHLQSEIGVLRNKLHRAESINSLSQTNLNARNVGTPTINTSTTGTSTVRLSGGPASPLLPALGSTSSLLSPRTAAALRRPSTDFTAVRLPPLQSSRLASPARTSVATPPESESGQSMFIDITTVSTGLFTEHREAREKLARWERERAGEELEEGDQDEERERLVAKMESVAEEIRSMEQSIPRSLDRSSKQCLELMIKAHFLTIENLDLYHLQTLQNHHTSTLTHTLKSTRAQLSHLNAITALQRKILMTEGVDVPNRLVDMYREVPGGEGKWVGGGWVKEVERRVVGNGARKSVRHSTNAPPLPPTPTTSGHTSSPTISPSPLKLPQVTKIRTTTPSQPALPRETKPPDKSKTRHWKSFKQATCAHFTTNPPFLFCLVTLMYLNTMALWPPCLLLLLRNTASFPARAHSASTQAFHIAINGIFGRHWG